MRTLEFNARTAVKLLGFPLTTDKLRAHVQKHRPVTGTYQHMRYTPNDIAMVREQLRESFKNRKNGKTGLPPIVLALMRKGGVGKSTTCGGVALACAAQGFKTLLIDTDPQASLTEMVGIDPEDESLITLGQVLIPEERGEPGPKLADAVIRPYADTPLDVIPCDIAMSSIDMDLYPMKRREYALERLFRKPENVEFLSQYDIVFIDSAPGYSLINLNLMIASSMLMCIVRMDGLSLKALKGLRTNFQELASDYERPKVAMFVANAFQPAQTNSTECYAFMKKNYGDQLFDTYLPASAGFSKQGGVIDGCHLLMEREPTHPAVEKLINLSREILIWNKLAGKEDF